MNTNSNRNSGIDLLRIISAFSIILLVNFTFKFSIKRKSIKEKSVNNENTVVNKTNINIPMEERSTIDIPIE